MKHSLCGALAAFLLSLASLPACAALSGDDAVLAARDGVRVGDRARIVQMLEAVQGHPLQSYVEYWVLRNRLDEATGTEVDAFLARHAGSVLAERLRAEWLRQLGRNRQWPEFERYASPLLQSDDELTCYGLQARLARADPLALDEALPLWGKAVDLPEACASVMDALVAAGRVGREEIWQRLRRQLEARRVTQARATAAYLPAGEAPDYAVMAGIAADPQRHLKRLKPNFAASRAGRELALFALQRLARSEPQAAASFFETLKPRFSAAERAYVHGQLGWQAALRHLPEALAWYKAADEAAMSAEQLAWAARAALRAQDWRALEGFVERMAPAQAAEPAWVYWLGRAHAARGREAEAAALYQRIAGQPHFYGILADEELQRPLELPPRAARPSEQELAQVAAEPGLQRALALFRLDLRIEAVREWNWSLRGRDDRYLLAAAELALRHQIFDRAINAAERTVGEHDYSLRYLAPFREQVEPKALELGLDNAWVYGLMRQESRFIMNARSSAGARGLMQLMPSTAKWVARKIGLKDFTLSGVNDMDTNVILGTSYLKMVLQDLDEHPVLASAAYNAGPGRARRWRDARPLEGAIYAETIPFNETRDYVKKVMANAVFYGVLFNGRAPSLKSRLGTVLPGAGNGNRELP